MKKITMKTKTTVKIKWSIHECVKFTIGIPKKKGDAVESGSELGYLVVQQDGRKKSKTMYKTLGAALEAVGI